MPITRAMEKKGLNNNNNDMIVVEHEANLKMNQITPYPRVGATSVTEILSEPAIQITHNNNVSRIINSRNFRGVKGLAHSFGIGTGGEFEKKLIAMSDEQHLNEFQNSNINEFNRIIDQFEGSLIKTRLLPEENNKAQNVAVHVGVKLISQPQQLKTRDSLQSLVNLFEECQIQDNSLNRDPNELIHPTNTKANGATNNYGKSSNKRKVEETSMEISSEDGFKLTITDTFDFGKVNTPPVKKVKNRGSATFIVEVNNDLIERGNHNFTINSTQNNEPLKTTFTVVTKKPPVPPKTKPAESSNETYVKGSRPNTDPNDINTEAEQDINANETYEVFKDGKRQTFLVPTTSKRSTFVVPSDAGCSTFTVSQNNEPEDVNLHEVEDAESRKKLGISSRKTITLPHSDHDNVCDYDITMLEDFADDLGHREKKTVANWARTPTGINYQLYCQRPPTGDITKVIFPPTNKKYRLYPSAVPPRRLPR